MNTTLYRVSPVGIFFLILSMFCIFFATPLFVTGVSAQAPTTQQDCWNALGTWNGTTCTNIPATTGGGTGGAVGGGGGGGVKYTPLVGIPGISGTPSLPDYINKIYLLTIAVGVFIAILRIAYAGVKYSMSGVVTDKASAKSDIKGVLIGLAILLLPALVLNTINPNLLRLDFLNGLPKLDTSAGSIKNPGGAGGASGPGFANSSGSAGAKAPTSQQDCWDALGTWNGTACTNIPTVSGNAGAGNSVNCAATPQLCLDP
ncbi:hypothetical protein IPH92_04135 [Candidatus Kaiserbacteria bacterium]|nr:MAG: hypothetical protein IPH92_04135 [Candidatus Kaiserbacteria bacterium]